MLVASKDFNWFWVSSSVTLTGSSTSSTLWISSLLFSSESAWVSKIWGSCSSFCITTSFSVFVFSVSLFSTFSGSSTSAVPSWDCCSSGSSTMCCSTCMPGVSLVKSLFLRVLMKSAINCSASWAMTGSTGLKPPMDCLVPAISSYICCTIAFGWFISLVACMVSGASAGFSDSISSIVWAGATLTTSSEFCSKMVGSASFSDLTVSISSDLGASFSSLTLFSSTDGIISADCISSTIFESSFMGTTTTSTGCGSSTIKVSSGVCDCWTSWFCSADWFSSVFSTTW